MSHNNSTREELGKQLEYVQDRIGELHKTETDLTSEIQISKKNHGHEDPMVNDKISEKEQKRESVKMEKKRYESKEIELKKEYFKT